jgi:SAM-dependent methyltransferase
MARAKCRVCSEPMPATPRLLYRDMPPAAQAFADETAMAHDRGVDLALYQCDACGLVQLTSPPVPYHREVIRATAYSGEMRTFRENQFADWVERNALAGRRVIEIGCGRGDYLSQAAGVAAHGLEHGASSVRECRQQGLNVRRGYLTRRTPPLPEAPFDGFATLNFLEHWPDPVGSLIAVARNLADGAVGLVEVPSFDMVVAKGMFSELFTEDTLRFALQRSSFEVLSCRSVWHDYILSAEVRKRPSTNLASLEQYREHVATELRRFIGGFPAGQVAVWGAGHQAQAVISLAGIASDIRYIVDSAPFKQGKFTPASHVRVVAPETLNTEPVQAVIVMAASYCDEVAAHLRRRFDPTLTVVTLRDHGLEAA